MCELAWLYFHFNFFNPALSRIYIQKREHLGIDQPLICQQCDDSPCKNVCLVQAFYKTEQGIVNIDEEKCISCGACAKACSYDAIHFTPDSKRAIKCDLCGGYPQCVTWCPADVLRYNGIISMKNLLSGKNVRG